MSELVLVPGDWVTVRGKQRCVDGVIVKPHYSIEALVFFHGMDPVNIEDVEGIPITPEVLRDWFGFRHMAYSDSDDHYYLLEFESLTGPHNLCIHRELSGGFIYGGIRKIGYVHELQQLHRALSGEPLTRKQ